jgi:hypothetical protein
MPVITATGPALKHSLRDFYQKVSSAPIEIVDTGTSGDSTLGNALHPSFKEAMADLPHKNGPTKPSKSEIAARCHEIQTGLGMKEVPEFDNLRVIGMAVRLALHIRGLPAVNFETLKLVANHFLGIPSVGVKRIVETLAEVDFAKLVTEGKTIKAVVPTVPYYETLYEKLGDYAVDGGFNEAEQLSIALLCRLSKAPEKVDTLITTIGAEKKLLDRAVEVGKQGAYVRVHRSRGRNIAISPTYFSENAEIYADMVAGVGAKQVQKLLLALRGAQGVPLSLVQKNKEIAGVKLADEELSFLIRLAQDGAVKPPSIKTTHAGENFFLFTPTPAGAALAPTKREIYEKAMAIVAAVRQGQYLSRRYAIRNPGGLIYTLKRDLKLSKATTEATQQYRNLVLLRVARLVEVGGGYSELQIIDTPENREALQIALSLVDSGVPSGVEVDRAAQEALQRDHAYVESLVASGELQRRETVELTPDQQLELEALFLK